MEIVNHFGQVIDLKTQLGYFKNVSRLLRLKLGDAEAESLLSRAVYLFSVGGNDYLFPFETNSSVVHTSSPQEFVAFVIGNITSVLKVLLQIRVNLYMIKTFMYIFPPFDLLMWKGFVSMTCCVSGNT